MLFSRAAFALVTAATLVMPALAKEKSNEAIWQERFEADCKAQARRYYSVVSMKKRKRFVQHCLERANR